MNTAASVATFVAFLVLGGLGMVFPWAFAAFMALVVGGMLAIPVAVFANVVWREVTGAAEAEAVADAARKAAYYAGKKLPR